MVSYLALSLEDGMEIIRELFDILASSDNTKFGTGKGISEGTIRKNSLV